MDMPNGPGMMQPSPEQGNVLASLKRNVLWGVLGLVALVFTTVCVMYVSSRQSEAVVEETPATTDLTPETAAMDMVTPPALPMPNAPATQTAALPTQAVLPTKPETATTAPVSRSGAVAETAKPEVKPVAAPKAEVKPTAKPAATKALDANNLPHGTKLYTIKAGDTLEKIAREVYGDGHKWKRLAELNKEYVTDINRLKVGQKILVERTLNPRDYADY